ncbi:phospholipid methyltransferase (macronuclear) [Tetrahymena thermophila SB210]|uniref:Phospholipid methyltransferase n=1 Tax=Tetrahymena thermophila (strain SB210) TaxID=312017 RepID=I7MAL5_TETTS|nr:phospholipid methyltransferase [Tetrahymena thermophila SB210]EAS04831.2 phospholipid methyltransferase [Tetrahymena thermophila SB210]|eukprot:XP_001025076.2 phospholipid methyltransferase [Tetrahymena thermophila SB210]
MNKSQENKYPYLVSLFIMVFPYALAFLTLEIFYDFTQPFNLHPLIRVLLVDIAHTILVFAFSFIFKNSSIYDPYWQTLPIGYAYILNKQSLYSNSLRNMLAIFPLLAYCIKQNVYYFRFWPGFQYEDFRYKQYSNVIHNPVLYWLFSFFSFHLFPTILVFLGLTPLYYILNEDLANQTFIQEFITYLGSFISLAGVIIEAIADEQLLPWRGVKTEKCIEVGLWKYSRHPNYFGQITIWWGIFISLLGSTNPPLWTVIGAVSITCLFNFYSVPAMEKYLSQKKPSYKLYQKTVSRLIPWFRKNLKNE